MREGGYVRYDGRKSTQVLRDCEELIADYGGSLRRLHETARDARDLEQRLLEAVAALSEHHASAVNFGRPRTVISCFSLPYV